MPENGQKSNRIDCLSRKLLISLHKNALFPLISPHKLITVNPPLPKQRERFTTLIVKPGQTRPNSYVPAFLTSNQRAFLPNRFYNKVKETNSSPSIRSWQGSKIGDKRVGGEFVEENPYRKSVTTSLPSRVRFRARRINIINVVRRWINSAGAKKRRGRVRGNARTAAKRNGTY